MNAAQVAVAGLMWLSVGADAQTQAERAGAPSTKSRVDGAASKVSVPFVIDLDAETLKVLQDRGKLKALPKGSAEVLSMSQVEMAGAPKVVMLAQRPDTFTIAQYPGEWDGTDALRKANEALSRENKLLREQVKLLEQKVIALQGQGGSK